MLPLVAQVGHTLSTMGHNVFVKTGKTFDLLPITSSVGPGPWMARDASQITLHVISTGAAIVTFDVSNDGVNAIANTIPTINLASAGSDGTTNDAPWKFIRARVTSVADTVKVIAGV